jgi:predicted Fe-Mo cluster-binding NifX family protein
MRLAVSSVGPDLSSEVDPRFGRCRYLIYLDDESGEWEAVPNSNIDASGGAGIRTAQSVLDRGVQAVITGNVGPNAMEVLSGGGVSVYTGASGTVQEALQRYREGGLTRTAGPTSPGHAGMQPGPLPGGGPDIFPGGGRGGRGRGGGGRRGGGPGPW